MPLFEYRCKKCGNTFEELVWGDRDRTVPCPRCGNLLTEKLISLIGGITSGKSIDSSCASSCNSTCPGISSCATAGSGYCLHAG